MKAVMAGQQREARLREDVPAIHDLSSGGKDVDARDKPGRDERRARRHGRSAFTRFLMTLPAAAISFVFSSAPAFADLKICNRMSYVVEAAIGIDDKAATATRGWFRIDPATCRVVVQGTLSADRILLNARALGVYGASPIPQNGSDTLCVAQDNFVIAAARQCRSGQTQAAFTQITPTQGADGNFVAYLAEDSEYDDEQARLAGIQRLLVIAGYDAAPIDGVDGPKTQGALAAFLKSRGLSSDILSSPNFFKTMVDAVQTPSATGLTWCNDTTHKVMAAVATDDGKSVTSRGWYRIDPKTCLHPDVSGPAEADLQLRGSHRRRQSNRQAEGQATELGRRQAALHARDQVRDQRADRLRRARFRGDGLRRGGHVERRQDAAVCDAVMVEL
ncbi:putative membrane protein [Bradyrhizobium sp. F1.13.4]